jgi:uncharacterized protein YdeI (YjbR/CyaY-like superfamily)
MPDIKENRIHAFRTPVDFNRWLEEHHASEPELWLKIYKKGSGEQTVSWSEAVTEALCWGWIDSVKMPLDDKAYLQRFTPRRKGSDWSKRNREHVEKLVAEGRMREPGLAHVRAAQSDGRWESAYAPSSEMTVPEDFMAALEVLPEAKAFFGTLNRANLYAIAYRLRTTKKAETRRKRFEKLLARLAKGEALH